MLPVNVHEKQTIYYWKNAVGLESNQYSYFIYDIIK